MKKEPYIKKFAKISNFTVWIVDGKYIRDNIDIDFVTYGQHYKYKFIPKDEFWIDKEKYPWEAHFYLKPLLVEYKLMSEGVKYEDAMDRANIAEYKERSISEVENKRIKIRKRVKEIGELAHKRLLKEYSKKVKVWIVDGELVRDLFSVDFKKGGHDKCYSFIPKNEIWIDNEVETDEIKFILIHEMHERKLMAKGMAYLPAHKDSNKIEAYCREHPEEIDKKLKEEIKENRKIK